MGSVSELENMLVRSGVTLLKHYLDIGRAEQKRRLRDRKTDPLEQWKVSPIDDKAIKHWKADSLARNETLARSHTPTAPWILVRANDKRLARLSIIKDLLGRLHYAGKDNRLIRASPVFAGLILLHEDGCRRPQGAMAIGLHEETLKAVCAALPFRNVSTWGTVCLI